MIENIKKSYSNSIEPKMSIPYFPWAEANRANKESERFCCDVRFHQLPGGFSPG